MDRSIILTGIRVNSDFTLGNYLGAIVPMINLQNQFSKSHQINIFIPDLHSFTTPVDHKDLYLKIINGLKYYVASGIVKILLLNLLFTRSAISRANSKCCF